jgi:hypothetical protein
MATLKTIATEQLQLLFIVFLMGSFFLMLPTNKPNACERGFHVRVFRTQRFLLLTSLASASILLFVLLEASRAEAAGARAKHEAAAVVKGVGAKAAKWKTVSLRALLLLAVVLSFAASLLAVVAFDDGFWFWTGCKAHHAGYSAGSPTGAVFMVMMVLAHGHAFSAWIAVCQKN